MSEFFLPTHDLQKRKLTDPSTDANTLPNEAKLSCGVCIIGSGAGGAVSAALLQQAGHDVLVVEEGAHRTRRHFDMREDTAFEWLYQEGGARATKDAAIALLQGRAVGGTTVVNWTTCFRTPERVVDHWRRRFGTTITHAELVPHWEAVEERLGIATYPLDQSNRNNLLLYEGAQRIGVHAEPTRRNVRSCARSGYCGTGCPVDAKQSMLVTYLPDAMNAGARIVHRLRVERLVVEAGRVVCAEASVLGEDARTPTGKRVSIVADKFILSGGAINTPAVLLRSGLGGQHSPVGKRTFLHPVIGVVGRYADTVAPFYGPPQSVASHHFADRGDKIGLFLEAAPLQPMLASLAFTGFGKDHRTLMTELPRATAHIALAIDGFSDEEPGGRVELHPSGAPVLDYPIHERVWEGLREGMKILARINLAAGAEVVRTCHDPTIEIRREEHVARIDDAPFAPGRLAVYSAHIMGGAAMGGDARYAVVRPDDLRHHALTNLHVIDGSVFPTSLGVNPQESIYGLAHLVASRLAHAWHA